MQFQMFEIFVKALRDTDAHTFLLLSDENARGHTTNCNEQHPLRYSYKEN